MEAKSNGTVCPEVTEIVGVTLGMFGKDKIDFPFQFFVKLPSKQLDEQRLFRPVVLYIL